MVFGFLRGGDATYTLTTASTLIGREPACDICLESRSVSGRHASIDFSAGAAHLRDLNSRNGTFVNETRVQNAIMPLAHADIIKFGYDIKSYKFEIPGAEPPTERPDENVKPKRIDDRERSPTRIPRTVQTTIYQPFQPTQVQQHLQQPIHAPGPAPSTPHREELDRPRHVEFDLQQQQRHAQVQQEAQAADALRDELSRKQREVEQLHQQLANEKRSPTRIPRTVQTTIYQPFQPTQVQQHLQQPIHAPGPAPSTPHREELDRPRHVEFDLQQQQRHAQVQQEAQAADALRDELSRKQREVEQLHQQLANEKRLAQAQQQAQASDALRDELTTKQREQQQQLANEKQLVQAQHHADSLRDELITKQQEVEQLQQQLADEKTAEQLQAQENAHRYEQSVQQASALHQDKLDAEARAVALEQYARDLQKQIVRLQKQSDEKDEQLAELSQNEWARSLQQQSRVCDNLRDQLVQKQDEVEALKQEFVTLAGAAAKGVGLTEEFHAAFVKTSQALQTARTQLMSMEQRQAIPARRWTELTEENKKLIAQQTASDRAHTAALARMTDAIRNRDERLATINAHLAAVVSGGSSKREAIEFLIAQLRDQERLLLDERHRIQSVDQQLAKSQAENGHLKEQLATLQRDRDMDELQRLRDECTELRMAGAAEETIRLKDANSALNERIGRERARSKRLYKELRHARGANIDPDQSLEIMTKLLQDRNALVRQLSAQLDHAAGQIQTLQHQTSTAEARAQRAVAKVASMRQRHIKLVSAVRSQPSALGTAGGSVFTDDVLAAPTAERDALASQRSPQRRQWQQPQQQQQQHQGRRLPTGIDDADTDSDLDASPMEHPSDTSLLSEHFPTTAAGAVPPLHLWQ
eukprot:TRINITY_DN12444_c0_g1_i1.p1 TRINITY_DN12444_c0_g1~~TRINITY_DN12444_c0_g1_i1.p1  ORF type:complete len:873 (+),score=215.78 TRINITY_DN12444_c0_g1_i1:28-2646(+)